MKIALKNSPEYQDIVIEDGVIIHANSSYDDSVDKEIDASKLTIWPGLADPHVHFRYPGNTDKEDWFSGTAAALAGGTTAVLDMPNNTPPVLTFSALHDKQQYITEQSQLDVRLAITITNESCEDFLKVYAGLQERGELPNPLFVKLFLGASTGNLALTDKELLERVFAEVNATFLIHAEDHDILVAEQERLMSEQPDPQPSIHFLARPTKAAVEALLHAIELTKAHNRKMHVCHVTSQEEIDIIRDAKSNGLRITAEVTPHHLWFSDKDYATLGNLLKVNPPIRTQADVDALWQALEEGVIDMVATDHAPHSLESKKQNYWDVPSGVPGVQFRLPLLLTAVAQGRISLETARRATVEAPRELLHYDVPEITVGEPANFTAFDAQHEWTITNADAYTKVQWTPYNNQQVKGRVRFSIKQSQYFIDPSL